jgi:hypothetical protein
MLNAIKTDRTKYKRFIFFLLLFIGVIYYEIGSPLNLDREVDFLSMASGIHLGVGRPLLGQTTDGSRVYDLVPPCVCFLGDFGKDI